MAQVYKRGLPKSPIRIKINIGDSLCELYVYSNTYLAIDLINRFAADFREYCQLFFDIYYICCTGAEVVRTLLDNPFKVQCLENTAEVSIATFAYYDTMASYSSLSWKWKVFPRKEKHEP